MKYIYAIFIGLILCFIWMILSTNFLVWLGYNDIPQEESTYEPYWYSFFFSCIWAPFWEEMMYRWAPIQIAIRTDIKKYLLPIIVISSATFGWGHGDCQEGVFIQGVLGLILSGVYVYARKVWCSISVHALYNSIIFFFL